ncbi:MAG: DUF192 domain-containing protein [Acetobacteraceae bacterium]|nr:DUF192 domain-containing protein [Acetobacteraceae bacterium]
MRRGLTAQGQAPAPKGCAVPASGGRPAPARGGPALLRATNLTRGTVLGDRIRPALGFFSRLRGLMFGAALAPGQGLYLAPCRQVHTLFMRCPLDLLYLDAEGRVVGAVAGLGPWRAGPYVRQARGVLELFAGTIQATGTRPGDIVELAPGAGHPPG